MKNKTPVSTNRSTALPEHAASFLRDVAVGQSPDTVETYRCALVQFKQFGAANDVAGALAFAQALKERGVRKSTLRTYLAAASRFIHYLIRKRILTVDSATLEDFVESLRQYRKGAEQPLPKLPPSRDVTALVEVASLPLPDSMKHADRQRLELERARNIALIHALRASGMRVGELVKLTRGDLDHAQRAAKVMGKGSKQRIVFFDDVAWDTLNAYLKLRGDGSRAVAAATLPVFARHGRNAGKNILPLTTNRVREILRELCAQAGIEFNLTPHTLRHAFATRLLDASGNLAVVQDALGHKSPTTTRIYADVSPKHVREAHHKAFGGKEDK